MSYGEEGRVWKEGAGRGDQDEDRGTEEGGEHRAMRGGGGGERREERHKPSS